MAIGSEWLKFGEYPGGKTDGLLSLDSLKPRGASILRGVSIGASYFIEFNTPYELYKCPPLDAKIPSSLHEVNMKIVDLVEPQTWLAIRSSATNEGASGIYDSRFYLTRGDAKDIDYIEGWEEVVYRSYFTEDARRYQRIRKIMGMGLLIQPVVGSWYGNNFAPAISGVCTIQNGQPLTKAVIGLGTKAARLDEGLLYDEPDIDLSEIRMGLKSLRYADVLDGIYLGVNTNVPISDQLRGAAVRQASKLQEIYLLHRRFFQEDKPFYWEFAIDSNYKLPLIVQ